MTQLDHLEELLAKAKVPWRFEERRLESVILHSDGDGYNNRIAGLPQWSPATGPQQSPAEARIAGTLIVEAINALPSLIADIRAMREALEAEWQNATRMRNASKLVGPYPNDRQKNAIWARALYHEGKAAHERMKPIRRAKETDA